jgi:hypothetical protein
MPMVYAVKELKRVEISKCLPGGDKPPAFYRIAEVWFDSPRANESHHQHRRMEENRRRRAEFRLGRRHDRGLENRLALSTISISRRAGRRWHALSDQAIWSDLPLKVLVWDDAADAELRRGS